MATPIPQNQASFSLADLVRVTSGTLLSSDRRPSDVIGLSTDTRTLREGEAFIAIAGESFDGHAHLDRAAAQGAKLAIVERDVHAPAELAVLRVESTVAALGQLARHHARRWRRGEGLRLLIAITGSAGKTTTRVALSALLEAIAPGEVHATAGNLNNLVGLPMTLLGLLPSHRYAVVELGTNRPGEIAQLAAIAEPDAAIVTLVSTAHVEGLGGLEGVAAEKGALFRALTSAGVAIGNGDDARVMSALQRSPAHRRITFGTREGDDYRIVGREVDGLRHARVWIVRGAPPGPAAAHILTFRTPLLGEAGALAGAASVAVVEHLLGHTISDSLMSNAMEATDVGGGAGRLVPRLLGDAVVVLDDSYNANPASACASIRAASEIARAEERRLVLVLGEMRELGDASAEGHDEVAEAIEQSGAAQLIAIAGDARRIHEAAIRANIPSVFVAETAQAIPLVEAMVTSGDLVLVKGSRGVRTDLIVTALVAQHGGKQAEDAS
jgi:UDP-N-acetylmuramoyl-tripeptide--D-alanyl-D-alanine ligase